MKRIASNPLSTRLKMRFSTRNNRKTNRATRSRLSWVWRGFWGCLGAIAVMGSVHAQQLGDRGEEVTRVQMRLQVLGYSQVAPTGVYDPATQKAVRDFQITHGLAVDGVVGSQTRSLLFSNVNPNFVPIANQNSVSSIATFPPEGNVNPIDNAIAQNFYDPFFEQSRFLNNRPLLERGSRDVFYSYPYVTELQSLLRAQGYGISVDGIFGLETENAVRRFQASRRLRVDGEVGSQTWAALTGDTSPGSPQAPNLRYVVVVPENGAVLENLLARNRDIRGEIVPRENRRGRYVEAGRFNNRERAESRSYLLRSQGFDARVVFF